MYSFTSFVPIAMKRNLVKNLHNRLLKLSSPEYKKHDEQLLKEALMRNGYPEVFINTHFGHGSSIPIDEQNDEKKPVVLRMQFRGDAAAELFRRKVERSLKSNCKNTDLRMVFTSRQLISTQTKDRLSVMTTPNVVYIFTCSICGMQ